MSAVIDTNVLLYAASRLEEDKPKTARAQSLMREPFGISGQILQEFYVNATRKIRTPLSADDARDWIDRLTRQPFVPVNMNVIKGGIAIAERYKINYWDAAIVAAAEILGAETLYTEDLNHGQLYGSVRVVNPFINL